MRGIKEAPHVNFGQPRTGSPKWLLGLVALLGLLGLLGVVTAMPSRAADNPYQRGPDPTAASVSASRGTFATQSVSVPAGNGFGGGMIYYPTDTSQGTFGAVAIVPGYTALFSVEEAWMGHWLASFGFVVIGVETNSRNDFDTARGTQLLAALDYLTQRSPVRDRVDATRLSVVGHSMGGGGALVAAEQRPSLKAAIGLAPFKPSGNLANDRVPTMVIAGQADTVVTPSSVSGLYATLPATTESAYLEFAGADHLFPTRANNLVMRIMIPWLKIFVDSDTRYTQFLCPLMDSSGITQYRSTCPLTPSTPTTTPTITTTPTPSDTPTIPQPTGACRASYRTVNSWSGGYQGEVTVTAGSAAINGWTVQWSLNSGQSISQLWSGTLTASGSSVTVRNTAWNGSLAPNASTTFGFIATGSPSTPSATCTAP